MITFGILVLVGRNFSRFLPVVRAWFILSCPMPF
jgi:hypothetical protein